jgi:hypothetical protein
MGRRIQQSGSSLSLYCGYHALANSPTCKIHRRGSYQIRPILEGGCALRTGVVCSSAHIHINVKRHINLQKRTKEKYESNALTEQAYLNNKKRFELINLDDLKRLNANLSIVQLTVDTEKDAPEDWYIIGREMR